MTLPEEKLIHQFWQWVINKGNLYSLLIEELRIYKEAVYGLIYINMIFEKNLNKYYVLARSYIHKP